MRYALLCGVLLLAACRSEETTITTTPVVPDGEVAPAEAVIDDGVDMLVANIEPIGDGDVRGTVTFTRVDGGVEVRYDLTGVPPGERGFHVHEGMSCGPGEDGTPGGAAGDHFNPTGAPHGPREAASGERHKGDFGNITADAQGVARGSFVDPLIELGGERGIVGRAVLVHGGTDDLASQPAGNAGARYGCGIAARSGAPATGSPAPSAPSDGMGAPATAPR